MLSTLEEIKLGRPGVAGDALENQRRSLLNAAVAELPRHQGKITNTCNFSGRVFDATCQKFNEKSKSDSSQVEKKLEF